MCCKTKWFGGLAALAGLLVTIGVLSGTETGRWLAGTAWVQVGKIWDWGQNQVSPEDELKRIANEVENLNKDIAVQFDKIVQQERSIDKVAKDVETRQKASNEQWQVITKLKNAVEDAKASEQTFVVFEGKKSDVAVARKELTERWDAFKRTKHGLELKEAELKEKKETLAAMNDNMNEMAKAKDDYALKVDALKTQLETARQAQAKADAPALNEGWKTRQTHIQDSLDRIGDQITSMNRMAEQRAQQVKTKADTGAAQTVKNDSTEKEIREFEEGLKNLNINK
jgi:chromosome segregation ATPase